DAAGLTGTDTVLEIGPGLGAMTQVLAENSGRVFAVENDPRLVGVLRRELSGALNLEIIEEDAMRCDLEAVVGKEAAGKVKMIANLPYNIAATLIIRCLQKYSWISEYVVMVQQEVAERILSRPGIRSYSAATVRIGCRAEVSKVTDVSRNCFYPKPKVDSTVVKIMRKEELVFESDKQERVFESVVSGAFHQRRKKLVNSVCSTIKSLERGNVSEALVSLGKDPDVRAEELSPLDFLELSKLFGRYL
ncbi:MAG: ribosomal RNA small subunit methyltransferase A, partial [Actinobacteria bacterium]|nr:ribosomal RNA small subunit methyltransferase A [Actinomycetota bacterium]